MSKTIEITIAASAIGHTVTVDRVAAIKALEADGCKVEVPPEVFAVGTRDSSGTGGGWLSVRYDEMFNDDHVVWAHKTREGALGHRAPVSMSFTISQILELADIIRRERGDA